MTTPTTAPPLAPKECDYLVIGGGATAMAFCDSLLKGCQLENPTSLPSVVILDPHEQPGGQWIDSYDFVQLHQPSAMYGVESLALEPNGDKQHRATRQEILDYYKKVMTQWEPHLTFLGHSKFVDWEALSSSNDCSAACTYRYQRVSRNEDSGGAEEVHTITVHRKVVDARFLQPDLPIDTPPKFRYDPTHIQCVPVNALATLKDTSHKFFVVIGGGKTGMDAVTFLLLRQKIPPDNILWIMPHDAWITARENIGNCMEFLHTALNLARKQTDGEDLAQYVQASPDCLQQAFLQWEQQGKVYRLDTSILPSKFKDATLSLEELTLLRKVKHVIRGQGRVTQIDDAGGLHFENGTTLSLPWCKHNASQINDTLFVHCSAGAFNYTKQPPGTTNPPTFTNRTIYIQDVYGTPGFCFVGSIIGKLESISRLTNEQKNDLCLAPGATAAPPPALGPSGGDIGVLSPSHGWVQRLANVRQWLKVADLRDWLVGHRLFNLGHYASAGDIDTMVDETWSIAVQSNLTKESS